MEEKQEVQEKTKHILNEHFWFTATTIGVNAFILKEESSCLKHIDCLKLTFISLFISFYGIYLILHRSAAHAEKLKTPEMIEGYTKKKDKNAIDKFWETWINIPVIIKHVPFVIMEFSGSLFYILLIVISFLGVLYMQ